MIKHHPKFELIQSYVNGELPASLAAGISIHAQMCPLCQEKIMQLTDAVAERLFEQNVEPSINQKAEPLAQQTAMNSMALDGSEASICDNMFDKMFDEMVNNITASNDIATVTTHAPKTITFKGNEYQLPTALQHMTLGKPAQIGKLTRSRIQLNEGEIHTSLLHIAPSGGVPEHTHKGFELTLLLEGEFSDEQGDYVAGDFIMLDGRHQHNPISAKGCLCYTVANGALHFTKGINKILNPIGAFIY